MRQAAYFLIVVDKTRPIAQAVDARKRKNPPFGQGLVRKS
jgi:hypothetical protein